MFGELAIIALSVLNQFGTVSADRNQDVFLGQFFSAGEVGSGPSSETDGWSLFIKKDDDAGLEPLPWKTGNGSLTVDAASAFAMDDGTDAVFFEKASGERRPIASITKIMTALCVLENSRLDDTVTITPSAMAMAGDKEGMVAGEKIKLEDLLKLMWVDSNNTAAYALAQYAGGGDVKKFVGMMNDKAEKLGLRDTRFYNPTGLDGEEGINYSTAYDLAQLTQYSLSKELIWDISRMPEVTVRSIDKKRAHTVTNTDKLLESMDNVYGGKTGYTTDAGECLVLISESPDKEHKVISVVLNAGNRFAETKKMVDWVFDNFSW